jgi:hypothetical protein
MTKAKEGIEEIGNRPATNGGHDPGPSTGINLAPSAVQMPSTTARHAAHACLEYRKRRSINTGGSHAQACSAVGYVADHDVEGVTEGWKKYYWDPWRAYLSKAS